MNSDKQSIIIAILTGTAFILLFAFFTFLLVLNFIRQKRRLLIERKIREAEFRQELLKAQLEMQEYTFKTVSQEIHDNVGQILSLAKLNLNILTQNEEPPSRAFDIKEMVTNAIAELRHLSNGYHADKLVNMGIIPAIQLQLQQLEKTGIFTTSFSTNTDTIAIEKNKTIFLYRMIQEILNNIVKHSGADRVVAEVNRSGDELDITISDNGAGFSTDDPSFVSGIGLQSLYNRARMIGATVDIRSNKDKGTIVRLSCQCE